MILLALFSTLIGAAFGLRFKIMVVMPLTVIGCTGTAIGQFAIGQSARTTFIAMLVFAVCLQAGYVFGSLTRFTMAALRTPRLAALRATASSVGQSKRQAF